MGIGENGKERGRSIMGRMGYGGLCFSVRMGWVVDPRGE